jgi:membrane protein DedA with SNARE-associated domain
MKFPWFKFNGLFFVPKNAIAWLLLAGALVYAVYSFIDIDSRSHSVSDTLMNFVFRLIIIAVVYTLIAYLTSLRNSK